MRDLDEQTTSNAVPGAFVRATLGKVSVDADSFLKDEPGVMEVTDKIDDRQFHHVVYQFTKVLEKHDDERMKRLVDAIIVNLTTKNDLTDQELDVLYTVARAGGKVKLEAASMTPGLLKALGKNVKGSCSCGFTVPKYVGRYPSKCPRCSSDLNLSPPPPAAVPESFKAFYQLLVDYHNLSVGKGISLRAIVEGSRFAQETNISSSTLALVLEWNETPHRENALEELRKSLGFESDEQVFEWAVQYMDEVPGDRFVDAAFATIFELFPIHRSPNLVKSIREEVGKKDRLSATIRSLNDNRYSAVKALSSCLTRLMIEAEARGGDFYHVVGEATFRMMERAFNGDLDVPVRFVRSYYGGGK